MFGMAFMLLLSCSSEDTSSSQSQVLNIDYFTIEDDYDYSAVDSPDYRYFVTYNLLNGKRHSYTGETFINGIPQGEYTVQQYFYTGDLLDYFMTGDGNVTSFFYDANQNLIGASKAYSSSHTVYYKYVYPSENIVYAERLTAPHTNPAAQISERMILKFDANGNPITAGYDNNFDGVMDNVNHYVFSNNNLITAQLSNGSNIAFSYSGIVNNFAVLDDNTFGKKVARLMCAEFYAGNFTNGQSQPHNLGHSHHLTVEEVNEGIFIVAANGLFSEKTTTRIIDNGAGEHVALTKFYFN